MKTSIFFLLLLFPFSLSATIEVSFYQNRSAPDVDDGKIHILADGTAGPFTFYWVDNGDTSPNRDNLSDGIYTVIVTNAYGCTTTLTQTISYCTDLDFFVEAMDESCPDAADGMASINVPNDIPPFFGYTFHWMDNNGDPIPGANTDSYFINDLGPGNYQVEVIAPDNCRATQGFSILAAEELAPVSFTLNESNCICTPGTGSISVDIVSDGDIESIEWTGPGGFTSNDQNISGLELPGPYLISVTYSNGCTTVPSEFFVGNCPQMAPYIRKVEVVAIGSTEETIYEGEWNLLGSCIHFSGGMNSFDPNILANSTIRVYAWSNMVLENLEIGIQGFSPSSVSGIASNNLDDPWKFLFPVGSFPTNGIPPIGSVNSFPIHFNGMDQNGQLLLDLQTMGNDMLDCIQVPDGDENCAWTMIEPSYGTDVVHEIQIGCQNQFEYTVDLTPPSDPSINDGSIVLNISNPSQYLITWTGPGFENGINNQLSISNLYPGDYCLYLTDLQTGCTTKRCYSLFSAKFEFEIPCLGAGNGSVCAIPLGGSGQYSYLWSVGSDEACVGGVSNQQVLWVEITDLNTGQSLVFNDIIVPDYQPASIDISVQEIPCPGQADGVICVTTNGGNSPFSYNWDDGSNDACRNNAQIGQNYSVTVTDACGETTIGSYVVPNQYIEPMINLANTTIQGAITEGCINQTGSISVAVDHGKLPYTFNWTGPNGPILQIGSTLNGLAAGIYSVTLTDACGSIDMQTFEVPGIANPNPATVTATVTHYCGSTPYSTGSIDLEVSPPGSYDFLWDEAILDLGLPNSFLTQEDLPFNLGPGYYFVTITDNNTGCDFIEGVQVVDLTVDLSSITSEIVNACPDTNTGSISLSSPNPLAYNWGGYGTGPEIENLSIGTYPVTITGIDGVCSDFLNYQVYEIDAEFEITVDNILGSGFDEGVIEISVAGEGSPYQYNWSNGDTEEDINNLPPGEYSVTVTNSYGCEEILSGIIVPQFTIQGGNDLIFECDASSGNTISVTPGFGFNGCTITNYYWSTPSGNSGFGNSIPNEGSGDYCVTVTDNCSYITSICKNITCAVDNCGILGSGFYSYAPAFKIGDQICGVSPDNPGSIKFKGRITYNNSNPDIANTLAGDIQLVWWTGEITYYQYNGYSSLNSVHKYINVSGGPNELEVSSGGTKTVKIIFSNGCVWERDYGFGENDPSYVYDPNIYPLDYALYTLMPTTFPSHDPNFEPYSVAVGVGCDLQCDGVTVGGLGNSPFIYYQPFEPCDPCRKGGKMMVAFSNSTYNQIYDIAENDLASEFIGSDNGDGTVECACYFPASILSNYNFGVSALVEVPGGKQLSCDPIDPPNPPGSALDCEETVIIESVAPCLVNVFCPGNGITDYNVNIGAITCINSDGECLFQCPEDNSIWIDSSLPQPAPEACLTASDCFEGITNPNTNLTIDNTNFTELSTEINLSQTALVEKTDINHTQEDTFEIIRVFPNPLTADLNIEITSSFNTETSFIIADSFGSTLFIQQENLVKGNQIISLEVPKVIPNGVYNLIITNEFNYFTERIVKFDQFNHITIKIRCSCNQGFGTVWVQFQE